MTDARIPWNTFCVNTIIVSLFIFLIKSEHWTVKCLEEATVVNEKGHLHVSTRNPSTSNRRENHDSKHFGATPPLGDDDLLEKMLNFTISKEKLLAQHLGHRYRIAGKSGRPVFNMSVTTNVEFGLGLIQMDLDERSKILTTSMWSRLKWNDSYLQWDPADYGGVTVVRVESSDVWLPDIMLYNTADPDNAVRNALVLVFYDGTLQWVPHQIFKSSCSIDVTNFPFDRQQCHMWFGSWTHSKQEIDLNLAFAGGIDLSPFRSDYKDSCEWDIVSSEAEKKLLPEDDPNPITVLAFTLNLERKLVFSSYILTLPCVFLASLTLVVFWLPPDRPDRTGLAMSLFSSFLVLLLILVEAAPPTASSVPLLGVYYCFNMVIIMLSIFLSSMVVNIDRAGDNMRPVPKWVRVVLLDGLGRMMCLCAGVRKNNSRRSSKRAHAQQHNLHDEETVTAALNNHSTADDTGTWRMYLDQDHAPTDNLDRYMRPPSTDGAQYQLFEKLNDIKRSLQLMIHTKRYKNKISFEQREITLEWRLVANVLDRLFFIIYLVGIILSLVILFPRSSSLKHLSVT